MRFRLSAEGISFFISTLMLIYWIINRIESVWNLCSMLNWGCYETLEMPRVRFRAEHEIAQREALDLLGLPVYYPA